MPLNRQRVKFSFHIVTFLEYLKVGDKVAAIQCLYDSLDPSRTKVWVASTEEAINKLLDICLEMQESESAKEALSQYRNICQQHVIIFTLVERFLNSCVECCQYDYCCRPFPRCLQDEDRPNPRTIQFKG